MSHKFIKNHRHTYLIYTKIAINDSMLLVSDGYFITDTLTFGTNFNANTVVTLKFSTTGDLLDYYDNSLVKAPNEVFLDNLLNIAGDTIFELDTANLNIIGTHVYSGLSLIFILQT